MTLRAAIANENLSYEDFPEKGVPRGPRAIGRELVVSPLLLETTTLGGRLDNRIREGFR